MTKLDYMRTLTNSKGCIGALAIDQRGALKKMIAAAKGEAATDQEIIRFKELVSEELTPHASAILLDPEYGIPAAQKRDETAGLLLAYEKTGYDATVPGRLPDILDDWSVKRLKEAGAEACKFLLYYDVDEADAINEQKRIFMERVGSECLAEDLPFFLELVSYDAAGLDTNSSEYAKVKPHKVIEMMKEFSESRYNVDVLKVEVPVNMKRVVGFSNEEAVYTKEEAALFFKEQAEATSLPFVFLSAGVSAELFLETLKFAKDSGSTFNGVLCGRATWADGVAPFVRDGEEAARVWLRETGTAKIKELNEVLNETATPLELEFIH
ncbi:tagatose 1,6-diphosphate aldolase [Listeria floridensis FSL S10-1187]|uniref:Tagatose 1,6-diphosphate aldolase n=1 Tax=Listeria floridensis FSL S10-1187 TaxID=1265817 RepID=A0ABP3AXJ9_9LIST|nr:tagatose-bisphosphate aldolase [Listeria floridensis]EUJ31373.1 tagatose 1,6-diphosphate aldolase [Listeria floridensis FSL S10-1187]